jgi:hypothetical protein
MSADFRAEIGLVAQSHAGRRDGGSGIISKALIFLKKQGLFLVDNR